MRTETVDTLVVGGGAAGMSAAATLDSRGYSVALVERDDELGGVLLQCIHNGFGLQEFNEELTGPEYAERWIRTIEDTKTRVFCSTTIMEMNLLENGRKECFGYSSRYGVLRFLARTVVLAMGCRERNRGNVMIPGTRPAGVYTAGLAQRLVNINGYIPGKDVVIVGSGDIGVIMARRMQWVGSTVHGVVEIQPYPSGLTRNISQCLHDFKIPLYLSHIISRIHGRDRIEAVNVTPLKNGVPDYSQTFQLSCDTLLLSVGLIPENELSKQVGIELNPLTGGPLVDSMLMTNIEGIFSAGNVLHVHDLVDYVSAEARLAGEKVAEYLEGKRPKREIRVKPGANVKYVNPTRIDPDGKSEIYLRPLVVANNIYLTISLNGDVIMNKKKSHVQPSEMIKLTLTPKIFQQLDTRKEAQMEVALKDES
ncbi:FAD-dependent oxidoreductase [Marispirochaeta sp.]|uniref:NAD(P)/FAD-dependent oxidoreductase n=1 Tax=Marispirochaeta sp. TaxID=2038653 RepID=UPI0029C96A79|nr:FAD-dependent oxidoreductase [Marispirochaeta sp.]